MDAKTYPVTRTEAEWRKLLTPEQYHIMREHGTERAGSCALNWEKRPGVFSCAGCDQPLFESKFKFESGTGWPSFNDPLPGAVETSTDRSLGHGAHGGALRALRLASRPCVPRRPAADGPALLHQRRRHEFHAGGGARERRRPSPRVRATPARRPSASRQRQGRRADRQSRHARRRPTTGRCGAISRSSCPTGASSRRRAGSGGRSSTSSS